MFLKFDTFVIKITLSLTMMACVVAGQAQRIPQNLNNPNQIIQHLLNTGQVSQSQVNNAMQMRNHPMFKGMF